MRSNRQYQETNCNLLYSTTALVDSQTAVYKNRSYLGWFLSEVKQHGMKI